MKSFNKMDIAIVGGGGHTKSIISILSKLNNYTVVGYTDLEDRGIILGVNYIGLDDEIKKRKVENIALGISYLKSATDRLLRLDLIKKFEASGFNFPVIISPTAIINKEVGIGNGTIVFDGVIVNAGSQIGKHGVLNTGCIVEHDCVLGENVFLSPGSILCGAVTVGNNVFIGAGSIIKDSVTIVDNVVIGTGSNVVKNIQTPGLYLGNPAVLVQKS
jgi:sugar O-acyltransferase (sialic acid O-acetyltransferase NeuD family)